MKLPVLLLMAVLPQAAPPDGPALSPNPEYPVHVRILVSKGSTSRVATSGYGRANLLDESGNPVHGVDFTYSCGEPMLTNTGNEFYQARWKKQDLRLELLMQRIGSNHIDKCELQTAVKPQSYAK